MGSGLRKAAAALAAADSVAHIAFLTIFGWRFFAHSGIGAYVNLVFGALALVGLALGTVGWLLVRYGGSTKLGRFGLWGVGGSTMLAALLLFVASITG